MTKLVNISHYQSRIWQISYSWPKSFCQEWSCLFHSGSIATMLPPFLQIWRCAKLRSSYQLCWVVGWPVGCDCDKKANFYGASLILSWTTVNKGSSHFHWNFLCWYVQYTLWHNKLQIQHLNNIFQYLDNIWTTSWGWAVPSLKLATLTALLTSCWYVEVLNCFTAKLLANCLLTAY